MALELNAPKGALFWAYISPQHQTEKAVTDWSVTITQKDGNWVGTITSANPTQQLQTPGLSGVFSVKVTGAGPNMPKHELTVQAGSQPDVGCNSNCAAMVGIVADASGKDAHYWTVWDAFCSR